MRSSAERVEIIAHRGMGQGRVQPDAPPENTLAAVRAAWEAGADAVEIDVRLTLDDELIVIHDATTDRTTGRSLRVAAARMEELRALSAGSWKGAAWACEKLPTLLEVLATIPAGKRLFVELKAGPEIVPALVRAVAASGNAPMQIAVISFNIDTMAAAKRALPEVRCYLLMEFEADYQRGGWDVRYHAGADFRTVRGPLDLDALISMVVGSGLDGMDASFCQPLSLAERALAAGLELIAWTVNDAEIARSLVAHGIRSITTDRPALLTRRA